jgi:hypothetical protein
LVALSPVPDSTTIEQIVELRRVLRSVPDPDDQARLRRVIRQMRLGLDVGVPKHRAAELLGITPQALERWTRSGKLPTIRKPGSSRELIEREPFLRILSEVRDLRASGEKRPMAKAMNALQERGRLKPRVRPNQSADELRYEFHHTTPADRVRQAVILSRTAHKMAVRAHARRQGIAK